ncbi:MAG TPA: 2-amino-4-hydroxy-6-hydroxymethyldihydropteridine diphosphokinase [Vicinamibacterales bacterium]|nr:2-amino-4-hydroxy-6-hydroxymethyldihydropteridine diphosphokinase [Vicinamibacterales bacterium]
MDRVVVAVSIGSNLGDRQSHLRFGIYRLSRILDDMRVSNQRKTAPVGAAPDNIVQPDFLNAAVVGTTRLTARRLLDALLAIEQERGRERPFPNAPRTLDLDLILYGDAVVDEPGLQVPHPRFRERRFVLEPLAEIAPNLVDPGTGRTIGDLFTAPNRDPA